MKPAIIIAALLAATVIGGIHSGLRAIGRGIGIGADWITGYHRMDGEK